MTDRPDRAAEASSSNDDVRGLIYRLLAEFDVLLVHMDESDAKDARRDEPDERTSPVEDVVKRQEDKFRSPSSCTLPLSSMHFKRW